ncbi:hypothetical protein A7975_18230 [Bacillus sp. FJAT-26390]|nr:hypothetical protein A7975_18230 [Bacillus sp. FJAT-26390]
MPTDTKEIKNVYVFVYSKLVKKLEKAVLIDETGSGQLSILDFEAALGKSVETERIIRSNLAGFTNRDQRNFLVVKRFRRDVLQLGSHTDIDSRRILGIKSDNWKDWILHCFPLSVVSTACTLITSNNICPFVTARNCVNAFSCHILRTPFKLLLESWLL